MHKQSIEMRRLDGVFEQWDKKKTLQSAGIGKKGLDWCLFVDLHSFLIYPDSQGEQHFGKS